jgi:hypothetical protein
MIAQRTNRLPVILITLGVLLSYCCVPIVAGESETVIPVLKTKNGTYTNVTITARSKTDVCLVHEGGVANVPYQDLTSETYALLDYVPPPPKGEDYRILAGELTGAVQGWLGGVDGPDGAAGQPQSQSGLSPTIWSIVGAAFLLLHLFFSYCFFLICKNAAYRPNFLIWLPVAQFVPLFRAAGMSGWWLLALFFPVVNFIPFAVWCVKIVRAVEKNPVWAVLLVLPITNVVALTYLAFSNGKAIQIPTDSPRGATTFMLPGMIRG